MFSTHYNLIYLVIENHFRFGNDEKRLPSIMSKTDIESNREENLPIDRPDGIVNELQVLSSQINKTIKNTKNNAVLRLLCVIGLIAATVAASINIVGNAHSFKTVNWKCVKSDTWKVEENMIITNYSKCTSQYDIGFGIRLSFCENEQYGSIVDIRHFLNNHSTVRGINLPHKAALRVVAVINKQI